MARQKDSLSLSAKKIRRRARFFLPLSSFSAPNAAKRVADAIIILTQRMKGPFALRRFFWFRADPIAERKGGQRDISEDISDAKKIPSTGGSPTQNCFFSSSSSSSSSLFFHQRHFQSS